MSKLFQRPAYLETKTRHIIHLPFVQTSGRPGSRYEWNNNAQAAIHSILAGIIHAEKKKDLRYWLETAQRQLDDAVDAIRKPHTRPLPKREP